MPDYIPDADDGFNHFTDTFLTFVNDHNGLLNIQSSALPLYAAQKTAWDTAWAAYLAALSVLEGARVAKDETRATVEAFLRAKIAVIQADQGVLDATRAAAGLPVRSSARTPVGYIDTHPVLYRVDQEGLLQRLWFSDSDTPGSKAKPKGAAFCEIRQVIQATNLPAPTDAAAMPYLCSDSKSPHRTDFDAGERGQTAYYAQRWVNTRQVPGPWGPITGYLVT